MWNARSIRMIVALLIFLSMAATTIQGDESSSDDHDMTEPSPDTSATTATVPIATARREAVAKRRAEAAEASRERRRKMMAASAVTSDSTLSSAAEKAAQRQVQSAQEAAAASPQQKQQNGGRKGRRHKAIHEARQKMVSKNSLGNSQSSSSSSSILNNNNKGEEEGEQEISDVDDEDNDDEEMEEETAVADEESSTFDAASNDAEERDDDIDEEKGEIDSSQDTTEESMTADDDSNKEQPSTDDYEQPTTLADDSTAEGDGDDDYNYDDDDDDDDMEKYLADFDTMLKEHDESMASLLVTNREKMEQHRQLISTVLADSATLEKVASEVVQQIHKVNVRQLEELRNSFKEIYLAESSRRQRLMQTISATTTMDSTASSESMMTVEELEPFLSDTLTTVLKQRDEDVEKIIVNIIRDKVESLNFPDFEKLGSNDDDDDGREYEVGSSSSASSNCVAPAEAVETIHQALVNYSNDFIGRHDHVVTDLTRLSPSSTSTSSRFSSTSGITVPQRRPPGGRIVHEMTSSTYIADYTNPRLGESWWRQLIPEDWEAFLLPVGWERWDTRLPLWLAHTLRPGGGSSGTAAAAAAAPPESILQSQIMPGACWPMSGATGHVTVTLPYNLQVDGISIDHASRTLLDNHEEQVKSAPRRVRVIGYPPCGHGDKKDDDEGNSCRGLSFNPHDPLHIMDLEYDIHKSITQTFDIKLNGEHADKTTCTADEEEGSCSVRPEVSASPLEKDDVIAAVRFEVLENWGNPEYTCLYRVRVHGKRTEVES